MNNPMTNDSATGDEGLAAILAKDDTAIMVDALSELFGADLDVDSRFTMAQVLTVAEHWFEQGKKHIEMLERAKAAAQPSDVGDIVDLPDMHEFCQRLYAETDERKLDTMIGEAACYLETQQNTIRQMLDTLAAVVANARLPQGASMRSKRVTIPAAIYHRVNAILSNLKAGGTDV